MFRLLPLSLITRIYMFRLRYLESIVGRCGHANLRIKLAVCSAIAICYAIHLYSLHMQLALYIYGGNKIAAAYVVSFQLNLFITNYGGNSALAILKFYR